MPIAPPSTNSSNATCQPASRLAARRDLRDHNQAKRRVSFGIPEAKEMPPDIEPTDSDEELERLLESRPDSEFTFGRSLEDEAEMGYLDEDNHTPLPRPDYDPNAPKPPGITRKAHNEQTFQMRKASVFDAIDRIAADKSKSKMPERRGGESGFVLRGVAEESPTDENDMDIDGFKVPLAKSTNPRRQNPKPSSSKPPAAGGFAKRKAKAPSRRPGYTRYELDWSKKTNSDENQAAFKQTQEMIHRKKENRMDVDGEDEKDEKGNEAEPSSVADLAKLAKQSISKVTAEERSERQEKRRANKKKGAAPKISKKQRKKQAALLSFDDDDE